VRTTISVDNTIYEAGQKRQAALRYKSFSAYVEYLLEKDTADRPKHITVREEPENGKVHRMPSPRRKVIYPKAKRRKKVA
jgi:hypothetical protein